MKLNEITVFVENESKIWGYSLIKQKIKETKQSFLFPKITKFKRLKKTDCENLSQNFFYFEDKKYFLDTPENREYYEKYNEFNKIKKEYDELLKESSKKVIEFTKDKNWNEGIEFYKILNNLMGDLIGKKIC